LPGSYSPFDTGIVRIVGKLLWIHASSIADENDLEFRLRVAPRALTLSSPRSTPKKEKEHSLRLRSCRVHSKEKGRLRGPSVAYF
jgi:hypothetical protein